MNVKAQVNYHIDKGYVQAFKFDVDGIVGNLISPELVAKQVEVNDMKAHASSMNFDTHGLVFVDTPSAIGDFSGDDWKQTYETEITEMLKQTINANQVMVLLTQAQ